MLDKNRYFDLPEFLNSPTALNKKIKNYPTFQQVWSLYRLATEVLDPIRERLGKPISVSSGFRSEALNSAIKGAKNSQHKFGEAADIEADDNRELWDLILAMIDEGTIVVGQAIYEYGTKKAPDWIHISLPTKKHNNEILYIGVK